MLLMLCFEHYILKTVSRAVVCSVDIVKFFIVLPQCARCKYDAFTVMYKRCNQFGKIES